MAKQIDLLERQRRLAWYLIVPAVFVVFLVIGYPLIQVLVYSVLKYKLDGVTPASFVGLGNYLFILTDPDFWLAVQNTLIFSIFSVTLECVLGSGRCLGGKFEVQRPLDFASGHFDSLGHPDGRFIQDLGLDVQRHLRSGQCPSDQFASHTAKDRISGDTRQRRCRSSLRSTSGRRLRLWRSFCSPASD